MTDEILALRAALEDVPETLMTGEERRVLADVAISLDVVERWEAVPALVVLAGPSGAGKSFVFNWIVGSDVSEEGVLRPTTSSVVVSADGHYPRLREVPGCVVVPPIDAGFAVADTPGWEHDPAPAAALIGVADLVIVVVSATRYADESVASMWRELDQSRAQLILNRVAVHGTEKAELLASTREVFGREPYVIVEDGLPPEDFAETVLSAIPGDHTDAMGTIMARAASAGARFVVKAVMNAAPDIGKVQAVVDSYSERTLDHGPRDVQAAWIGTRDQIIEDIGREIRERDEGIVRLSESNLGSRILGDIGPWDATALASDLDDWKQACIDAFRDKASIRWRRAGAEHLIDSFSWKCALSSDVVTPRRFSRIMGGRLVETAQASRTDLEVLLNATIRTRTTAWTDALERLGDYQPGDLLVAADSLTEQRDLNG